MMGTTHALLGAACGWSISGEPLGAAVGALAGLLPDLDHPQSLLGRRLWPVAWTLNKAFGHRSALHSLAALLLVALAARALLPDWWQIVAVGYASHLLADALTVAGVPLLWPLKFRFRFLGIRTGGIIEHMLMLVLIVVILASLSTMI